MPGIVGLVTQMPRECAERELMSMVSSLRHEPFYTAGTWIDEPLGIYIGWTAHANSFCDGMPLANERGDVVLVFSGEEFAEHSVSHNLKRRGHVTPESRASYLVQLYEQEPCAFPANLNGRFHGLLADRSSGSALLFNDRYGMHRIYYHQSKEAFYFAAEAKAILAARPELRMTDSQSVGEFIACGCVLENRTLFPRIRVLPPASAWVFEKGGKRSERTYFEPRQWEELQPMEPRQYYDELRDVFSRNLPRYLNGAQPIGMSLSGGLDTRAVMAWQKFPPGALDCYTYSGNLRACRDVVIGKQVADACQQRHHTITVGSDFLCHFPRYAERTVFLSDGCVDLSRSPDLYLSERAREIAPVRMTGLYGDEVFRQSRAFKALQPSASSFDRELLSYVELARTTYTESVRVHPLTFAAFRQAPWHHHGILALEETQITARTPFLDNDLVSTVFRAPKSATMNNAVRLRLIADGNPGLLKIQTDRGFAGNGSALSSAAFRKLIEFTFKAEYAYDYGMPQWLARLDHIVSRVHLERLFLGRHKVFHFRVWYRDALSWYVREMLLDSRALSRPWVQRKALESLVRGHLKGDRNYTSEIHKHLSLELFHRIFLDGNQR